MSVTTNLLTRNQLIEAALRKLGALSEGQTPSTQNYTDSQQSLNMIIAQYRSLGMPLWARQEYTFTPTTGVYTIGEGMTLNTPFPVKMLQAYRTETNTKIDLDIVPKEEFNILPGGSTGSFIKLTYTPSINYGTIALWPAPGATNTAQLTLVYIRPLTYTSLSTDTLDMPEEWQMAVVYGLAVALAPEWGIPLPDRQYLEKQADKYLDIAASVGQDVGSFYIQPARAM